MAPSSGITRREVLTRAAGAAAAASLGGIACGFPGVGGEWPDAASPPCGCTPPDGGPATADNQLSPVLGSSTVATIQRDDAVDSNGKSLEQPQLDAVESMINAVLTTLAGGAVNPWSVILPGISNCTRIGLKVNCLNGYLPTSPAVVRAIIRSLQAHHPDLCAANIIVWDRRLDELNGAGRYTEDHLLGARLLGTIHSMKERTGPGYSIKSFGMFEGKIPRLSRILLEQTDFTINLPVLKRHGVSGVTAALKNIYGIIDIPGQYHGTALQTALPALYAIPAVRNSIKLTIVDGLRAVINGDTDSSVDATPGRIFGSLDPLAVDYYALDLLNQLRATHRPTALGPINSDLTKWLDNAYALGLGAKSYNLVSLSPTGDAGDGGVGVGVDSAI